MENFALSYAASNGMPFGKNAPTNKPLSHPMDLRLIVAL